MTRRPIKDSIRGFTPCKICCIGLGSSIQDSKRHIHINKKNKFKYKKRVYFLCDDCYEEAIKDPRKLKKI